MRLRSLAELLRRQDGVAAIEFALILPIFLVLLTGVVEIGLAVRDSIRVQEAVSAGALYANQQGFNAAQISTAETNATAATGLTATPAPTLWYGCPSATGVAVSTFGATCADGFLSRTYVTVNAQMPRTQVFGAVFGLPATLTASSTARLQ